MTHLKVQTSSNRSRNNLMFVYISLAFLDPLSSPQNILKEGLEHNKQSPTAVKKDVIWTENLVDTFSENFRRDTELVVWQYYCSEYGVMRLYPAPPETPQVGISVRPMPTVLAREWVRPML
eukprot:sb/3476065/